MNRGGLSHVVVVKGNERHLVARNGFVKELDLQSLIRSSPELLAPLGAALQFVPIGWEVPLGPGKLDLLFLDSEGVLTLVETKLRANDESRRAVLGQILEYASFASEWSVENVRATATAFLGSDHAPADIAGQSLEEAIARRCGWLNDEEDERTAKTEALFAKLDASLRGGRLRVVCGVDERIETLERLVRYLSAHSDLQVVLLQVNRFTVEGSLSVLVPSMHGDVDAMPGRVDTGTKHTVESLIDSFPEGRDRQVVASLIKTAASAGASFAPGPSGLSIRAQTPLHHQPVTVAWIFAPGRPGWMRTRDISFGHGLDLPSTLPALRDVLRDYYLELVATGCGEDASSKGVQARWMTVAEAARRSSELEARLAHVIHDLGNLGAAVHT